MEKDLGVEIHHRGYKFHVIGQPQDAAAARSVMERIYVAAASESMTPQKIHLFLKTQISSPHEAIIHPQLIRTRKKQISGRNNNQNNYLYSITQKDINFGIGPAGTGKTYLAVAAAVEALEQDRVKRIVLTRPAVEAGEKLGFLPGDLSQKVDPYLRPLYDALFEMMGFETVEKLLERNIIEILPLAFMRGRTLNDAFIILDEAQNTTVEQMKMFLTRIGFGTQAVITGDITQCDLPPKVRSGLRHVIGVLEGVEDIGFTFFNTKDVVRHNLVQKIIEAYERFDERSFEPH